MSRDQIFYPEQTEARIQEKLSQWFEAPVVLASSSAYRKDALEEVGFKNVDSFAMPDEAETVAMHELGGRGLQEAIAIGDNLYTKRLPTKVAEAKIDYLVENGQTSSDNLLVAADTMPRISRLQIDADGKCTGAVAEYLTKPASEEQARENLLNIMNSIVEVVKYWKNGLLEQLKENANQDYGERASSLTSLAVRAASIEIGTGMAVRLPNTHKVETIYSAIYLIPVVLYDIAMGKSNQTPEDIADQIIDYMKKSGKPMTKVAGGINYGDENIREILQTAEGYDIAPEKGIYLGMPQEALLQFLREKASQM